MLDTAEMEQLAKALFAFHRLSGRELQVLKLRFGIGSDCHSFADMARIFRITRERVRQIENKASQKIFSDLKQIFGCDSKVMSERERDVLIKLRDTCQEAFLPDASITAFQLMNNIEYVLSELQVKPDAMKDAT